MPILDRRMLAERYYVKKLSVAEIAAELGCSPNRVIYWMDKYGLNRRGISDAIYSKHNPNGDPFSLKPVLTLADAQLLGTGLGLYWGEGTKSNNYSIRLGNTDPELIKTFVRFLVERFGVNKRDLHFGLQLFTDIDPELAKNYWLCALNVEPSQFYRTTVTISGSIGTYRKKSEYGVITVYYHNKKLRDTLVGMLPR